MSHHTNSRLAAHRALVAALASIVILGTAWALAAPAHSAGPSATTSASGVNQAKQIVARLLKPTNTFTAPGPKLNVKSLKGKTVYYVPITLEDPEFSIVAKAMKVAFGKAGVKVQACDGKANPSGVAACLGRAASTKAGGVIVDSIPYVLAANAFDALEKAKIPILITDQIVPPAALHLPGTVSGFGDDTLGYMTGNGPALVAQASDWVAADSNGKAKLLMSEFTDSFSTKSYVATGQAELKKVCPGCTTNLLEISNANLNLVPSQTSAALVKAPDTNYVMSEFDAALQPIFSGVQKAGFAHKAKGVSSTGVLGGLQMIKAKNFLAADVGTDFPFQGWAAADEMFRMMLHKPLVKEKIPARLFTSANIGSLKLTPAAEASGEWYGGLGWKKMFAGLWGTK